MNASARVLAAACAGAVAGRTRAAIAGAALLAMLAACGGGQAEPPRRLGASPSLSLSSPGTGRVPDMPCPPSPVGGAGRNFDGQTLFDSLVGNFVNASFRGATLPGTLNGDFTGADFTGASFPGGAILSGTYDGACFKSITGGAGGLFEFWSASVAGADFSNTDSNNLMIVFWAVKPGGRVDFRNATVNCAVLALADSLVLGNFDGAVFSDELSETVPAPCLPRQPLRARSALFRNFDLKGLSVAGYDVADSVFDGAQLDDTAGWAKASFARATFRQASLKRTDFEGATIVGVDFSGANLEEASFAGARFPPDANGTATQFRRAHLKNVSFKGASAAGVQFDSASFYGTMLGAPSLSCKTLTAPVDPTACGSVAVTGRTCSCASMSNADLAGAVFTGAFLYGADFGSDLASGGGATVLVGTDFSNAVLVGANFTGAQLTDNGGQGGPLTRFDGALLQGAAFDAAASARRVSFAGAFVDAGLPAAGSQAKNSVYWLLAEETTQFPGWTLPGRPCLHLEYDQWSAVPQNTQGSVCADGQSYGEGCGALVANHNAAGTPVNPRWKPAGTLLERQGWYRRSSTYEAVTESTSCGGVAPTTAW